MTVHEHYKPCEKCQGEAHEEIEKGFKCLACGHETLAPVKIKQPLTQQPVVTDKDGKVLAK